MISTEDNSIFHRELEKLLTLIGTFPEVQSRNFMTSLAETIDDFKRFKFEPYLTRYPR